MIHSKVTRGGQVTIPKALREDIGWEIGDYVEMVRVPDGIPLKPKKVKLLELIPFHGESLADYHRQYESILQTQEPGTRRDAALSNLMDALQHAFQTPLLHNEALERENKAGIALYRIISESRTTI